MMDFLKELGEKEGFDVGLEKYGRFDQFWKGTDYNIAIEHEIDNAGIIKSELDKLLHESCELKVLITYVRESKFAFQPYEISRNVEKKLNENLSCLTPRAEILLLIGTKSTQAADSTRTFMDRTTDWFARRYCVGRIRIEIIKPSMSQAASTAWKNRKGQAKKMS
jgi:hypothetical protein